MRLYGEDDPPPVPPGKVIVSMAAEDLAQLMTRVYEQLDRLESRYTRDDDRLTKARSFTAFCFIMLIISGSISLAAYLAGIFLRWYTSRPGG